MHRSQLATLRIRLGSILSLLRISVTHKMRSQTKPRLGLESQELPVYRADGTLVEEVNNDEAPISKSTVSVLPMQLRIPTQHWTILCSSCGRFHLRDFRYVNRREALGQGDQGTVYKVRHQPTGKLYALKEFDPGALGGGHSSPGTDQGFKAYAAELVTLFENVDSSFVIEVYEVWTHGAKMKVLMELMDLGSLTDVLHALREQCLRPACQEHLAEGHRYCKCSLCTGSTAMACGRLCNEDLSQVASAIVHALQALHAKQIIHRDIKPSNVLVNTQGTIKVCDFGVSRLLSTSQQLAMTTTGSQLYYAPERIVPKSGYGLPADVWSLGVLLGYCAVGRHPVSDRVFECMTKVMEPGFRLKLPSNIGIDPLCCDFVEKCCTYDSARRPTAVELCHHPFLSIYASRRRPNFISFVDR